MGSNSAPPRPGTGAPIITIRLMMGKARCKHMGCSIKNPLLNFAYHSGKRRLLFSIAKITTSRFDRLCIDRKIPCRARQRGRRVHRKASVFSCEAFGGTPVLSATLPNEIHLPQYAPRRLLRLLDFDSIKVHSLQNYGGFLI